MIFPDQKLPSFEILLKIAEITEADIDKIAQEWINSPPDTDFKYILEAEEYEPESKSN